MTTATTSGLGRRGMRRIVLALTAAIALGMTSFGVAGPGVASALVTTSHLTCDDGVAVLGQSVRHAEHASIRPGTGRLRW